ncbi:MAG TPA: hypothetical protein VFQ85_12760 [Mycobacteriales bacterium]|jgi:hypothetical protein|nr:hypothetical protein [Mycobacteriales bacterium]
MKVLRTVLAVVLVMIATARPAAADHIRAMVAYQVNGNPTNGEITLRVDFNYSGNCCGGAFSWDTGEATPRYGWVPDGIDNGAYVGNVSPTTSTFSDGSSFTWSRAQPDPSVPLVRIDITWRYPATSTPTPYVVTWDDCCPQSNQKAVVVAGAQFQPRRILAADTGNSSLTTAFAQAQIPPCPPTPTVPADALCYDLLVPLVLPYTLLDTYDAILVGSEAQAATVSALGTHTADIDTWLRSGDARGIAVYGQSAGQSSWSWLPTAGQPLTVASTFANDVTVTPSGMAHLTHVNQLPTVGAVNGTLAGWSMSAFDTFAAPWPSYFAQPLGDPLATRANGAAVALAGHYAGGAGCQVVTGQPIDDRAAAGRPAAQQMFRSTLAYALSCVDAARA